MAGDEHLCSLLTIMRSSRKLSLRKMAEICEISRETIRKYESGTLIPSNQATESIVAGLSLNREHSRQLRLYVYQARRRRLGGEDKAFGVSAQAELERLFTGQDHVEAHADQLVELFFSEVDPERRTESFKFFLKNKVLSILRG